MKKIALNAGMLLFFCSLHASDAAVEAILEKFDRLEALQIPASVGYRIYDPFKAAAPMVKKGVHRRAPARRALPAVTAVMNDRAFVGGRWVRVGDRLGGYTVAKIGSGGVVLKKGRVTRLLPLSGKKKILQIKENL